MRGKDKRNGLKVAIQFRVSGCTYSSLFVSEEVEMLTFEEEKTQNN